MFHICKTCACKVIVVSVMLIFSVCSYGCAGGYIDEYIPLDPYLSGKVIHFNESVIYFVFNDPKLAKQFGFLYPTFKGKKIIRQILSQYSASNIHSYKPFRSLPTESIKKNMGFTIVGCYRVSHFIYDSDYTKIILLDENDILSVYLISAENLIEGLKDDTDLGK